MQSWKIVELVVVKKDRVKSRNHMKNNLVMPHELSKPYTILSGRSFSQKHIHSAGGILVGFKKDEFEVIGFSNKTLCVVSTVRNKCDGFVWQLVVVYGLLILN